jgi:hypothetical protein
MAVMRTIGGNLIAATLFVALAACSDAEAPARVPDYDIEVLTAEAREAIKDFGPTLKAELQTAMAADGAVAAIKVCNLRAPDIAAAKGDQHGFRVGRTSHRVRSPANVPDEWEAARLQEFLTAAGGGVAISTLEFAAVVESDDGPVFRYMKAIPTEEVCLVCHGQELAPEVLDALNELYPEDQARSFETGDLRGAFTLTRDLN